MGTGSTRRGVRRVVAATALGLLLTGTAAAPAVSAETIRQEQWYLDRMQAENMWKTSTGRGVTVAVIDTGVDGTNPDLIGRVLPGKNYATDQPGDEHTDYDGHGTGMAGLIAATGANGGGRGSFGLAPGAKILPIRLPESGKGANLIEGNKVFNGALAPAIRYATDHGAKVINISQAAREDTPEVAEAVKYALKKGSLIFAGVGNDAEQGNLLMYPAATPGVVGVAAVGKNLHRTDFSQYGPQVDMAAPGEDMVHACGGKTGLCETSGTSDATALASASAALIWSVHPTWTNNQVLRVMLNTIGGPTDGAKRNDAIGYGIVRPRIALQNPGDPGPADVYPLPDLAEAQQSASPAPTPSAKESEPAKAVAATKGDDGTPWLGIGLGVGALGVIGVAAAVVVRKRRTTAPPTPQPQQHPTPQQGFGPPPVMPGSIPPPPGRDSGTF
ncbi:type VII secretion-associated serine protease mycosin [Streptomyces roseirectus]|uniref:Type VII secretion-associated serine protease mycosin n=1 Tax=Streptomyces roseirectus TaxID=2768066 RepID=A0A7H0IA73_9ACTN|nr:type VII secretion-associated serine protease mycosin [Streptomyces roseirectus]QNP69689.1 type VII secretion-associated serine protease mycosin [Streptomyces roseirectus]